MTKWSTVRILLPTNRLLPRYVCFLKRRWLWVLVETVRTIHSSIYMRRHICILNNIDTYHNAYELLHLNMYIWNRWAYSVTVFHKFCHKFFKVIMLKVDGITKEKGGCKNDVWTKAAFCFVFAHNISNKHSDNTYDLQKNAINLEFIFTLSFDQDITQGYFFQRNTTGLNSVLFLSLSLVAVSCCPKSPLKFKCLFISWWRDRDRI